MVIAEEKYTKQQTEQHEQLREAMIADIQLKSKKGRGEKDHPEDTMELDDMPNSGVGGTLSGFLGLGGKRTK